MSRVEKDNLGFLGEDYQLRLIAQLITDKKFANDILDIIDVNFFGDEYLKLIAVEIKNAYNTHQVIPDFESLEFRLKERLSNTIQRDFAIGQLNKIKDVNYNDSFKVQEIAMKFCKQQALKKSVSEINVILERGDYEEYDECEVILKKALSVGENKDFSIQLDNDIDGVLADDFRNPIATGIKGFDEYMNGGLAKTELGIILAPFGVGKALPNSNKIYTPEGFKLMGSINVGDKVFGRNGKETNVIGVYPQGIRPIFKITFNDTTSTFCDEEHLWAVNSNDQRNHSSCKVDNSFKVVKTSELINNLTFGTGKDLNFKIPMVEPIEFNEQELPIDPYVLGVMLRDGNMKSSTFTSKDLEVVNEVSRLMCGVISIKEKCLDIDKDDVLVKECLSHVSIHGITDKLKSLSLYNKKSNNKFIPISYLHNSKTNRLEILRGLLDADGNVNKNGSIEYVSVSKKLIDDVKWLVLSLGGFCELSIGTPNYSYDGVKKVGWEAYVLIISFPSENKIKPFKLARKNELLITGGIYNSGKFIKSIEYSHKEEATCIMVDNVEQLFVTDDFIVTHNTTMITKIANSALNQGFNVLQIFFEDNEKVIQRKHYACWTNIELNELSNHKELVKKTVISNLEAGGELRLLKMNSDNITIAKIKLMVRKLIANGFRPDMILIDYIDCVEPSRKVDDTNVGEGRVMREFETMLNEFDMAGWTAVQGNRCVALDTKVDIEGKGTIEIKDVVLNDKILTKDGYKMVSHIFPIQKQPVYKIKLKSGKEIKVSKKHFFPTSDGVLSSIESGLSIGVKLLIKK